MKRIFISILICVSFFSCAKQESVGKKSGVNRIVSLAPSVTELVYFTGCGEKLVGRSDWCNYPPEITNLPSVGGLLDTDLEKVVGLKPDLVIASYSGNSREKAERLQLLGLRVVTLKALRVADILSNVRELGRILDVDVSDKQAELQQKWDEARRIAGAKEKKRVLFVVSVAPVYVASTNTFISDVLAQAGYDNVVKSAVAYPLMDSESLLRLKPDWVMVTTDQKPLIGELKRTFARIGLKPEIVTVEADKISRPGPRVFDAMLELAE